MYTWSKEETENARIAFMRFGLGPKSKWQERWEQNGWTGKGSATTPSGAQQALLAEIDKGVAQIPAQDIQVPTDNTPRGRVAAFSFPEICQKSMNIKLTAITANGTTEGKHVYERPTPWDFQSAERARRYKAYIDAEIGFVERFVLFWVNHFSIYTPKQGIIAGTAGHLERDVIRKHALGSFSDMLKGVMRHPAMITYLDNHTSVGPNSNLAVEKPAWGCTYNENLAREILELHTVGPYQGFDSQTENYTQDDVINLAQIITGWTIYPASHEQAGQFYFDSYRHEPGDFTVLGKTYKEDSKPRTASVNGTTKTVKVHTDSQGLTVLDDLAKHPETAKHIAIKLLRHFVTDYPDPRQVETIKNVFLKTEGNNLLAVAKALVQLEYAWTTKSPGIRKPYEWLVSVIRATGVPPHRKAKSVVEPAITEISMLLSNLIWQHMTPDGYSDYSYVWQTEDAIRIRKDAVCMLLANGQIWADDRWKSGINPATGLAYPNLTAQAFARRLLPGILSANTEAMIAANNANKLRAMALLFVSPEYLRR